MGGMVVEIPDTLKNLYEDELMDRVARITFRDNNDTNVTWEFSMNTMERHFRIVFVRQSSPAAVLVGPRHYEYLSLRPRQSRRVSRPEWESELERRMLPKVLRRTANWIRGTISGETEVETNDSDKSGIMKSYGIACGWTDIKLEKNYVTVWTTEVYRPGFNDKRPKAKAVPRSFEMYEDKHTFDNSEESQEELADGCVTRVVNRAR